VKVFADSLLGQVPLTFTGGILGKRFAGTFYAPVRTKNAVREIPPAVWYRSPLVHYLVGGFLPFRYADVLPWLWLP
jgi:hypothetical protein